MADHAFCRARFRAALKELAPCLASKGIRPKDLGVTSTRIGSRRHYTVEGVGSGGCRAVWLGVADCAWEAKAKAVTHWCGLEVEG